MFRFGCFNFPGYKNLLAVLIDLLKFIASGRGEGGKGEMIRSGGRGERRKGKARFLKGGGKERERLDF